MSENFLEDLRILFEKDDKSSKYPEVFILNRMISFKKEFIKLASRVDKFTFLGDKRFAYGIMKAYLPKQKVPWFNYVKKPKIEEDEYEFLFKKMKKYFKWSDGMWKCVRPYFLMLFNENPEALKEYMFFFGADRNKFKKYKIKLEKPVVKQVGIGAWFK